MLNRGLVKNLLLLISIYLFDLLTVTPYFNLPDPTMLLRDENQNCRHIV